MTTIETSPKKARPKTYFGFPVAVTDKGGERGIALIIAVMILSIMMLFTSDLILSSQVDATLAGNVRDSGKAEYLAKSAVNVARLLISTDFLMDLELAQLDPKATLKDTVNDVWSAMNGLPIGGESLAMFQEQFNLNAVMDSTILDQLKQMEGHFTVDVSDESSRINVNDCFNSRCAETMLMLEALFSCPAEKMFLDEKKVTGRELAYRVKDFIDKDNRAEEGSGFNDENEPYAKRQPKQLAKNAPLDAISELRQIEGWDEEVYKVFSPHVTAFPFAQGSTDRTFHLNVNTASRELLQCLFPEVKGTCAEKVALHFKNRGEKSLDPMAGDQKVSDILRDVVCYTGGDGNPGEAQNRANWFQQNTDIFRVKAEGSSGDALTRFDVVIQRIMPDPKKKEMAVTRVLYWNSK